MRIAVFGLGYVGSVTAACLAEDGHFVVGVDPDEIKVNDFLNGRGPVREPGLDDLIAAGVAAGRLTAVSNPADAVADTDVALICVGTPSRPDGSINLDHVEKVSEQIGVALRQRSSSYTVIVRSTVLPGTTRTVVVPVLEASSGRTVGDGIDVCFNPEFLREGTSIKDYRDPSKIVVGTEDGKPNQVVDDMYANLNCPRFETAYEVAELSKYVDNTWHALKVSFANEIGRIAQNLDIDGRDVMEIMTGDTKLNISPKYLRPGFAFGGSCLPKDVAAIRAHARQEGLDLPVIDAITPTNDLQIDHAIDLILGTGATRVGLLGLTFKADTDDLRNSPLLELARRLINAGREVRVFEPNLSLGGLIGTNRQFVIDSLPGIETMLIQDADAVLDFADLIVLGKYEPVLLEVADRVRKEQTLVDLAGMASQPIQGEYVGIAW